MLLKVALLAIAGGSYSRDASSSAIISAKKMGGGGGGGATVEFPRRSHPLLQVVGLKVAHVMNRHTSSFSKDTLEILGKRNLSTITIH